MCVYTYIHIYIYIYIFVGITSGAPRSRRLTGQDSADEAPGIYCYHGITIALVAIHIMTHARVVSIL